MGLTEPLFTVRARGGINPLRDLREARSAAYEARTAQEREAATQRLYRMAEAVDRVLPRYWRAVRELRAADEERRLERAGR